ncbi:MAG: cobaltochelatase subunit CobN [Planctomycetota bacterium]
MCHQRRSLPFLLLSLLAAAATELRAQSPDAAASPPEIVVVGRDGAVGYMSRFADAAGIRLRSLSVDAPPKPEQTARAPDVVVFLWGDRRGRGRSQLDDSDALQTSWRHLLGSMQERRPDLTIVCAPGAAQTVASWLPQGTTATTDAVLDDYLQVGIDRSNLRRLVSYLAVTHAGLAGTVEPPDRDVATVGIYHPEHDGLFASVQDFLDWTRVRGRDPDDPRRIVVRATSTHFVVRNRDLCEQLIAACDRLGMLAFVYIERRRGSEFGPIAEAFRPRVLLDTRHRGQDVDTLASIGAPTLQCSTLARSTIEAWRTTKMSARHLMGLTTGESSGWIEPHVVAGRRDTGRDLAAEFAAIPERVERVVARAARWIALATEPVRDRRVAMFVGGMGGGTADNQQLAMPASIHAVLTAMRDHGYAIENLPADADRLYAAWSAQLVDADDPAALDRLARTGNAALVPVRDYLRWYEHLVPAHRRAQLERRHGAAPGTWRVWRDDDGASYFVMPRLPLGNVALVGSGGLPPDEAKDFVAIRRRIDDDLPLTPSHNQLALAFWLEHADGCDAAVHWGSFQFDLLLPEKPIGLDRDDWPDILTGTLPNIRPFSMTATTFAAPARRRTFAVLVNHLTAPVDTAGLHDELLDLSSDLHKWAELPDGSLREHFRESIQQRAIAADLHVDLRTLAGDDEAFGEAPWRDGELDALARHLARIEAEQITTTSHTFGREPRVEHLLTQMTATAGRPTWQAIDKLFDRGEATLPGDADRRARERTRAVLTAIERHRLTPEQALVATGATLPGAGLDDDLSRDFGMLARLRDGYRRTGDEIGNLLAALDGRFVPPGPVGPPERNPLAVPSGRNTCFANPEELPTRASWQLATRLCDDMLAERRARHGGRWPRKVALVVTPRRSLADFGVSEAQAFWLIGVRPVWSRGRVADFEVIPAAELGRPRIDVLLESKHHYNDYLETRAELIDRAVRTVCELDEPDNFVRSNRLAAEHSLRRAGVAAERAAILSRASILAVEPGRFGSGRHDQLFEATGVWDTREQLTEVFLREHDHVYTKGAWGVAAPEAVGTHLAQAEIVLSGVGSRSALTGRGHYSGGNLAQAIERLSGSRPDYYLADLRHYGDERVERAEVAVRRDFRSLVFNRKWLEGMQHQGRNGAHRMAAMTWKALGWSINRPDSITPDIWQSIVDVYLHDEKGLGLPSFFEHHDPKAMQEITKNLLEAVRKGYWHADPATVLEIAETHARSRARHGQLLDDNGKLDRFVVGTLHAAADEQLDRLVQALGTAPQPVGEDAAPAGTPVDADAASPAARAQDAAMPLPSPATVPVSGRELVDDGAPPSTGWWWLAALLLLAGGLLTRRGAA